MSNLDFSDIFGHTTTLSIIRKQIEHFAFPHAVIFTGTKGVGKFSVAYAVAKSLTLVSEIFVLTPATEQMESVREMSHFMSIRPVGEGRRVCIVDNAEELSVAAQNLLLKQVEEAPAYLHIIFVSSRPLLPTLESRCHSYHFGVLSNDELSAFATSNKISLEFVEASGGAGGMLEILYTSPEIVNLANSIASATVRDFGLYYVLAEKETDELQKIFLCAASIVRNALTYQPERLALLRKICASLEGLEKNLNKKLNLQKLLLT